MFGSSRAEAQAEAARVHQRGRGSRLPGAERLAGQVENEDMPRLNVSWTTPGPSVHFNNTQLGQDVDSEASDLQQYNSVALNPSVIDNQQGVSNTTALSNDCSGFGVTLNWTP
jgi:hypothetical protein